MLVVHAADLHLDSPLSGLEPYEGAPLEEIRGASRRALQGLVDLCLERRAALLLIAGDLYDGQWRDYSTGLFFLEQMGRLTEVGTEVVWIRGNHDAASKITRYLSPPPHVRELSTDSPETVTFQNLGLAVHGIGYATRDVQENLAARYPAPVSGMLNFGLLHTAVDGRPGHAPYAPCKLQQLRSHGYDYWALGHIHQREVLSERPWVVFSGNLQGRHIRESGEKGATLIEVDADSIQSVTHQALDVVRWQPTCIDASQLRSYEEAIEAAIGALRAALDEAQGRILATRIQFVGQTRIHSQLLDDPSRLLSQLRLEAHSLGQIYIERVDVQTLPEIDLDALRARRDALGELFQNVRETIQAGEEEREELLQRLFRGLEAVPSDLTRAQAKDLDGIFADAERLLMARLLESGEGE